MLAQAQTDEWCGGEEADLRLLRDRQYGEAAAKLLGRRRMATGVLVRRDLPPWSVGRACVGDAVLASERATAGWRAACVWHKGTGNSVALRNSGLWNMQRMQVKMSGLLGVQTPREWTGTAGLAAGGVSECCARRIKAGLLVCAGVSSCGGEAGSGARGCVKRRQRNASRVVSSRCVRQQHCS
jgi:hypothetical protein